MMKKLFLFTLLVSSFLVISCKNNTTNSTSGGWGEIKLDYKANGISSIYEGKGYKFFSMDGETYIITIQNGGITGLQQGTLTVNLSKSDIYSVNAEGDTIESLGNNAKVYLIYNNELQGSIIFPTDANAGKGSVNITKSDGSTIEGIIRTDLPDTAKISKNIYGDWEGMILSGLTYLLNINDKTIKIYSDASLSGVSIPTSFFEFIGNDTYVISGNYYSGTSITLLESYSKLDLDIYDKSVRFNPKIEGGKITGYIDDSTKEEYIDTPQFSRKSQNN